MFCLPVKIKSFLLFLLFWTSSFQAPQVYIVAFHIVKQYRKTSSASCMHVLTVLVSSHIHTHLILLCTNLQPIFFLPNPFYWGYFCVHIFTLSYGSCYPISPIGKWISPSSYVPKHHHSYCRTTGTAQPQNSGFPNIVSVGSIVSLSWRQVELLPIGLQIAHWISYWLCRLN